MSRDSQHVELDTLWEEIRQHMGVCPSFFKLASADPALARGLFDLAKFAYLESPLPSIFKEKLFTYLSRFCGVRYCVTRHAAFLVGRGHIAGDSDCSPITTDEILALLTEPFPERDELPKILSEIEVLPAPFQDFPSWDSSIGRHLRIACAVIFMEAEHVTEWCAALRRLFSPQVFQRLMLFLAFVRIAHFWTQVHAPVEGNIPTASELASFDHDSGTHTLPPLFLEEDLELLFQEQRLLIAPLLQNVHEAVRFELGPKLQAELQELRTTQVLAQALKKSEARYRDLYENAPDMFCSIDVETQMVVECNQTLLEKIGFTKEDVIGKSVFQLYDNGCLENARLSFERFLKHGFIHGSELKLRTRNGKSLDVSLSATAVRDDSGRIIATRSIFRDISKQKNLEDQQRLIFESSPNGILVVNEDGLILKANFRIADWLGYRHEELVSTSIEQLVPERLHGELHRNLHDISLRPQARIEEHGHELYGLCQDGREIALEVFFNPMSREYDGTILIKFINVTERKRDREVIRRTNVALQEQFNLTKTITDNASTSLLMIDITGLVTFANPATEAVLGFKPNELIGNNLHDMVHHTHADGTRYPMNECPITGTLLDSVLIGHEDVFIHKLGHFYPVRCNARQIFHDDVPVGIVIEVQDVTELQRAEEDRRRFTQELARQVNDRTEDLVHSQKRLRELAIELNVTEQRERQRIATELHDYLSQLLVVCRLKLGQIRQVTDEESQGLSFVKETEDVLDQALTYTRTLVAQLSPSVLFEFGLISALQWLAGQMIHHGLKVDVKCENAQDLELKEEQSILLYQSTRELLLNVIKHAGTDHASLSLHRLKDRFRIMVRDTGKGFPVAQMQTTKESSDQSLTFGLFSIYERMLTLGGSFEIQSEPGQGTVASLYFPLQKEFNAPTKLQEKRIVQRKNQDFMIDHQSDAAEQMVKSSMSKVRILLVDDHVMVREGLRKILETHEDLELVGEAGNGEDAVELVKRLKPSMVIMDVNMPKLNGIEATARIKAYYQDTIIIGLSVNTDSENQRAMLEAGAIALLPKEAAVADLYHTIQAASKSQL
ncbi:PAS domain S-box protein [Candidatus Nitrospira salsa]